MNGLALLRREQENQRLSVSTGSKSLDRLLDGGVAVAKLTEICGAPGIGKTQLSMQLCVKACLRRSEGGLEGRAVYVDTEGSFAPERIVEMLQAVRGPATTAAECEDVLTRIRYFRVFDHVEQVALFQTLPDLLREPDFADVRVIVVDSIAFHFRLDFADYSRRARLLSGNTQDLLDVARQFNIAVVLINQMTTKFTGTQSHLVPALGESWGHQCTVRLLLHWDGVPRRRVAFLCKANNHSSDSCVFDVSAAGIVDCPDSTNTTTTTSNNNNNNNNSNGNFSGTKKQKMSSSSSNSNSNNNNNSNV